MPDSSPLIQEMRSLLADENARIPQKVTSRLVLAAVVASHEEVMAGVRANREAIDGHEKRVRNLEISTDRWNKGLAAFTAFVGGLAAWVGINK